MKILFETDLGRVVRYEGTIEVLGQGKLIGNSHLSGKAVNISESYDYIRFLEKDGSVKMLPKMTAYNLVGSYLRPGFHGTLYVFEANDSKASGAVLTMISEGRKASDINNFWDSMKAAYSVLKWQILLMVLFLMLGIIFSFFLIGIPLVIYSIYCLYKIIKFKIAFRKMPLPNELTRMIETDANCTQ